MNLKLPALDGPWLNIGLMSGRKAELDMAVLLSKCIQWLGSTLCNRDESFKPALLRDMGLQRWPLFAEARLHPQLARTFLLNAVQETFATPARNRVNGRLVLLIDERLSQAEKRTALARIIFLLGRRTHADCPPCRLLTDR
jgi:NADPH:quinone reductase-like Zn-dependent oxidoreductase